MRWLAALALLAVSCADTTIVLPRYWTCQGDECDPGAECTELRPDTSYCTTECATTDECLEYGWPAVCREGHCWGECWPNEPEDLAFCREYGFLCPSDCAAQGLVCDSIGGWPPRYGCVP